MWNPVSSLQHTQAPKAFIALVLLVSWMDLPNKPTAPYEFFDLFAGKQAATRVMTASGYRTASYDWEFEKRSMNFLGPAGFVLAVSVLLDLCPNGLLLAGPDCSSWGVPACGTSMRNYINIAGNIFLAWVRGSSTMVSRLVLCILLAMSRNIIWVVEQPSGSLLPRHSRFEWLMNVVAYVYMARFWMMLHGAPSSKPTICFSNMREIGMLDLGTLTVSEKEKRTTKKLTRQYHNAKGEKRFQGTRDLRGSQAYPEGFAENLRRAFEQHLVSPALRDLRFKVEFDKHLSARDQFTNMPMGNDLWLDANLLEPLEYVMTSKYLRIPPDWHDAIHSFMQEYRQEVLGDPELRSQYQELLRMNACT